MNRNQEIKRQEEVIDEGRQLRGTFQAQGNEE